MDELARLPPVLLFGVRQRKEEVKWEWQDGCHRFPGKLTAPTLRVETGWRKRLWVGDREMSGLFRRSCHLIWSLSFSVLPFVSHCRILVKHLSVYPCRAVLVLTVDLRPSPLIFCLLTFLPSFTHSHQYLRIDNNQRKNKSKVLAEKYREAASYPLYNRVKLWEGREQI